MQDIVEPVSVSTATTSGWLVEELVTCPENTLELCDSVAWLNVYAEYALIVIGPADVPSLYVAVTLASELPTFWTLNHV